MQGELKCFGRGVSDDLNKRVYEIWRGEVGDKWTNGLEWTAAEWTTAKWTTTEWTNGRLTF